MAEIRFLCSKCGFPYRTELEALECEGIHLTPESIGRYKYDVKAIYPDTLEVVFSNDTSAIYSLVKISSESVVSI